MNRIFLNVYAPEELEGPALATFWLTEELIDYLLSVIKSVEILRLKHSQLERVILDDIEISYWGIPDGQNFEENYNEELPFLELASFARPLFIPWGTSHVHRLHVDTRGVWWSAYEDDFHAAMYTTDTITVERLREWKRRFRKHHSSPGKGRPS